MTPLLRWGRGLLKLDMLQPHRACQGDGPLALTGNQALSIARPGLQVALRGPVTHEMRETLKIWGVQLVEQGEAYAPPLVELDADVVIAPAEDIVAVRARRRVALIAADEELPDLPREIELPADVERVPVSRAEAAAARSRVARELGLLATHAGAAAAVHAHDHGGIALLCAPGEREFSLDR